MKRAGQSKRPQDRADRMKCDDIQDVLFDYMSRELGAARSELVSAHLRKCDACRATAAEIRETLAVLQAGKAAEAPMRLSADRRARIHRAIMHPILDWIFVHHILVSLVAAALALVAALAYLRTRVVWETIPPESIPVNVGGTLPAAEEEAE